jgi:hypothetical protein
MIFSDFISQHNYYEMPFMVLVCISTVYALLSLSYVVTVKNISARNLLIAMMVIATAASGPFIYNSVTRMHSTVFLGLDVAGESIKEFTKPEERVFLMAHSQSRGISRYARRYMGWPDNLEDFKEKESKFGIKYLCFYPAEYVFMLKSDNPKWFEHIMANYHVREIGITEEPSKIYYIILERGKGSEEATFLKEFSGPKQLRCIYKLMGKLVFFNTIRVNG